MEKIIYTGVGNHSVRDLEKIVEQQIEELHQKQIALQEAEAKAMELSVNQVNLPRFVAASMHRNLIIVDVGTKEHPDHTIKGADLVVHEVQVALSMDSKPFGDFDILMNEVLDKHVGLGILTPYPDLKHAMIEYLQEGTKIQNGIIKRLKASLDQYPNMVTDLLAQVSKIKFNKARVLQFNESILRCVGFYMETDKDRTGADPEKRQSKVGMINVLKEVAEGQKTLLTENENEKH